MNAKKKDIYYLLSKEKRVFKLLKIIVIKKREKGFSGISLPRTGRKRKTTLRDDNHIVREIKDNLEIVQ